MTAPTTQAEQEDAVRKALIAFLDDRYWQSPEPSADSADALLAGPLATLRTERDQLAADLRKAREENWQPIKSAPKDGSALLLACADWPHSTRLGKPVPVKVGGWHPIARYWQVFGASWVPTHWMQLPDPPALTPDPKDAGGTAKGDDHA